MAIRPEDVERYLDTKRWASLAELKREAWLRRWRAGPIAQMRAIDELRSFAHSVGARASKEEREQDATDRWPPPLRP